MQVAVSGSLVLLIQVFGVLGLLLSISQSIHREGAFENDRSFQAAGMGILTSRILVANPIHVSKLGIGVGLGLGFGV